jgi:menaquinone-dependent protoporphyrinogen IX oxidase
MAGGGHLMKIEYLHASKYGNGAKVAAEFQKDMVATGAEVDVHHIREVKPSELPAADLYLFSAPGRFGKPIRRMRRFLGDLTLPPGTRYAILTTEAAPKADKKTGRTPTEEELIKTGQRVRPIMTETLGEKGLVKVGEDKVYVTGLKGPLEEEWRVKVADFAARIMAGAGASGLDAEVVPRMVPPPRSYLRRMGYIQEVVPDV